MIRVFYVIVIMLVLVLAMVDIADAREHGSDGWGGIADRYIPPIPQPEYWEPPWWAPQFFVDLFWWLRK